MGNLHYFPENPVVEIRFLKVAQMYQISQKAAKVGFLADKAAISSWIFLKFTRAFIDCVSRYSCSAWSPSVLSPAEMLRFSIGLDERKRFYNSSSDS